MHIVSVAASSACLRLAVDRSTLRPGGTVSGPAMFMLADFSIYVALLATLGPDAIEAVTSNLNITFLTKPEPVDLIADARLIRLGRRMAYAEVSLRSIAGDALIAHATANYALPPSASAKRAPAGRHGPVAPGEPRP